MQVGEQATMASEFSAGGRIGPNSVLQTLRAVREAGGDTLCRRIERRADLPAADAWPAGLIPESWFVRLVAAVRAEMDDEAAEAVLRRAGAYTAGYVAENRIPSLFRWLVGILPSRWAVPMLLAAFKRHAWTFAGSGRFSVEPPTRSGGDYALVLDRGPSCQTEGAHAGGSYYEAAFEGLLRLASPHIRVREVACHRQGAHACRYALYF